MIIVIILFFCNMNKSNFFLIIGVILITSCTIQKRTHRNGYYIDWYKKSANSISEKVEVKNDFVASSTRFNVLLR